MVNEEIYSGIKTAISHGYSMEKAVQSFINAGYNANDVREAANLIIQGKAIIKPQEKTEEIKSKPLPTLEEKEMPEKITEEKEEKPKKNLFLLSILIILLAILVGSIIAIVIFWTDIVNFINNLFS